MKFTRIVVPLSLVFLSVSCKTPKANDCKKFRTGNFRLHPDKTDMSFLIVRNDSVQIETENQNGKRTEWKIKWINDCKYNLVLSKDNFEYLEKGNKVPSLTFEIISTANDYYIFKQEFDLFKPGFIDTIWKSD